MSIAFAPGLPMVMAPVNMPMSGPDVGYSAVDPGYYYQSNVVAPLADPYAGQGVGIYNDASMYRGGDFWGGGSDPYAGTGYAGGGDGSAPLYSGGGIGSDAGATGGRYWDEYGGGVYGEPRDFSGNWWTDLGVPIGQNDWGQPSPSFDYNAMNSPSFDGNWGDAAYAFNPRAGMDEWGGIPDTSGGQGFNQGKDQSQVPSGPYQPAAPDWSVPEWLRGAGRYWDEYGGGTYGVPRDFSGGGGGGIGSDALRDSMAWTLAQSSPYATPDRPPSNGPLPNLGYNPGMENWFANQGMNQFNPDPYQRALEQILRGIDQGTGNQNLDPNWFAPGATQEGGRSFYQGSNLRPDDFFSAPPSPGGM